MKRDLSKEQFSSQCLEPDGLTQSSSRSSTCGWLFRLLYFEWHLFHFFSFNVANGKLRDHCVKFLIRVKFGKPKQDRISFLSYRSNLSSHLLYPPSLWGLKLFQNPGGDLYSCSSCNIVIILLLEFIQLLPAFIRFQIVIKSKGFSKCILKHYMLFVW